MSLPDPLTPEELATLAAIPPCTCPASHALAEIRRVLDAMPAAEGDRALLDAARSRLGSDRKVADALGVGRSVVSQWRKAGRVPAGRRVALAGIGMAPAGGTPL